VERAGKHELVVVEARELRALAEAELHRYQPLMGRGT